MSREPRINISLNANQDLVFDPWTGFRGNICIAISSAEEMTGNDPPSIIEYHLPSFRWFGIDTCWAFAKGLLVVRDQGGKIVPIDYLDNDEEWSLGAQYLRGSRVDTYHLSGANDHDDDGDTCSLREMRKKVVPGTTYILALTDQPFAMQACFMGPYSPRLQPGVSECWVNASCCDNQIPFDVLAAAPVPRFTASISTSSNTCYSNTFPDFTWGMTLTSLSRTPVKVSSHDLIDLQRVATCVKSLDVHPLWEPRSERLRHDEPKVQLGSGSSVDFEEYITFPYGGTWTGSWSLTTHMPTPLSFTCRLSLSLGISRLQLRDWNYSDLEGGIDVEDKERWPSKGYIELNPVYHGWDKVESMLETAKPMPFFKLPREVRDIVYSLVKFASGVEEVQFTFVAGE